ncbi:MAG: methyltransferase domain-containing protein [Planctomycetota bacterium]|nr:methyltransferase domain-containing protein [Planctomycetota bacterium]
MASGNGEINSGVRRILRTAPAFTLFTRVIARRKVYRDFIANHVDPGQGGTLLDCGCGTGRLLDFLSDGVDYTGFDLSSEYVKMASRRYGNTGRFIQASVDDPDLSFDHQFDTVL